MKHGGLGLGLAKGLIARRRKGFESPLPPPSVSIGGEQT
jgi:hypothetical protein